MKERGYCERAWVKKQASAEGERSAGVGVLVRCGRRRDPAILEAFAVRETANVSFSHGHHAALLARASLGLPRPLAYYVSFHRCRARRTSSRWRCRRTRAPELPTSCPVGPCSWRRQSDMTDADARCTELGSRSRQAFARAGELRRHAAAAQIAGAVAAESAKRLA